MTDEEMRELDAWLAEHAFRWVWVRDYKWDDFDRTKPYKRLISPQHFDPERCEAADGSEEWGWLGGALPEFYGIPRYTAPHADLLRSVKREIERRGWSWKSEYFADQSDRKYQFMVFTKLRVFGRGKFAETEELAGCLALKQALEATDGEDTG